MAAITGTEGADALVETSGVDTINAFGGDDTIIFDKGSLGATQTVDGGSGSDRLVVDSRNIASGVHINVTGMAGPHYSGQATNQGFILYSDIEHFTVYHRPGGFGDPLVTGLGDDVYHYTVTNDATFKISLVSFVNLGGGSNDRVIIDASAVTSFAVTNLVDMQQPPFDHMSLKVGGSQRIDYTNVERVEFVGGLLGDTAVGLAGNDLLDGRDGNDALSGLAGNDRLIGGNGNDSLSGGEGDDILVFTAGTDTADGGNGGDRLEIDARGQGGGVQLIVAGAGPDHAGAMSWAGGSVDYSGIESFTIYSNAGNHADDVHTASGDDVFHHYGLNDLFYLMDTVDLGAGADDLLVADFSAVADHAVTNRVHPSSAGHYLFDVGGNGKIDYAGVERLHFIGGAQGDAVTGHGGGDLLEGRAGDDTLAGGDGNDDLSGGTGANSLDGGNHDDILRSGSLGIDTVQGGSGEDTAIIDYSAQASAVTNVAGGDVAFGNGGDTKAVLTGIERIVIATGSGNDDIATLGGDDEIRAGAGADLLDGGAGDDYLDGGAGVDSMTGGDGDDVYAADDSSDSAIELAAGGLDEVRAASATYTLPDHVENLTAASSIAHEFRGNGGNNVVTGESAGDSILLHDGGADSAFGLGGDDLVYFGASYTAADHGDGGVGRDVVVLQGNYTLTVGGGSLTAMESLSLQSGSVTRWGDVADNFYDYDITTADDFVAAGVQMIVNAQSLRIGEDFTFDGSAETDGKFLVYGGHGVDDLTGGAGADVFFFEGTRWGAADRVDGGAGRDSIVISSASGLNHFEFSDTSFTGIEAISVNNRYTTDPGQKPSYELVLANGNVAPGATLILNGSSITDAAQFVIFDGGAIQNGKLILFSGAGDDALIGGAGADLLYAAGGGDELTGGGGADNFQYRSTSDSTAADPDRILDFAAGVDKIDLHFIDSNTLADGDQSFSWIGSSAFGGTGAASAGQLRAYQSGGDWFVEGDTNGDGNADLVIVVPTLGGGALGQGDFLP
jgi:Ca2+-binding RTX toxin-like protein